MTDAPGMPASDVHAPTSHVLAALAASAGETPVTLDWLMRQLGERSFGIILLVLSLIAVLPGISVVAAVVLMIPAVQMALARPAPTFPRFIGARQFEPRRLDRLVTRMMPVLLRLERVIRPRWHTPFEATKRVVGVVVLLLATVQLVPVPMSNLPPAVTVMLIAVAFVEKDGVLLAIALGAAALVLAAAGLIAWQAGRAAFALF
ncbi:exopolysaccharide biosynthesis protein [Elioraea rosea]|uniref:exopolysaccharide biosynthesis protein n=1 Tax=Elioraea rosea TaxID=2492390 RepID=UPI001EF42F39|nr:exopolysaccharide biosynthesis protein [Elioraea rosea]